MIRTRFALVAAPALLAGIALGGCSSSSEEAADDTANANAASSDHGEGGGIYVNGGTASLIQNQVLDNVAHVRQAARHHLGSDGR